MVETIPIGRDMKGNDGITTYLSLSDKRIEGSLRKKKLVFESLLILNS